MIERLPREAMTPIRFGVKFLLLFAILMGGFEASRGSVLERFLVEDLILAPTVGLINAVTPNEHARQRDRTIESAGSRLHVTRGCEGIEMFLMLIAAMAAFPSRLKHRLQGLAMGALIAYLLSIARLMALHYILRYSPTAWNALHGLVLPLGPIVVMGIFFMRWSNAAAPAPARAHAA